MSTQKNNHGHTPQAASHAAHGAAAAPDTSNAIKDPDDWKTGDEPATGAQLSYLKTLSEEAGEAFDESEAVTKAEASRRIDALREKNPRVQQS